MYNPEYHRQWYLANKARILANAAERRRVNPEPFRAISRNSYLNHREKNIARTSFYLQEHPDVKRKADANYRLRHPEAKRKWDRERRVKKYNAAGFHTFEQWMARVEYYGWKCYYCRRQLNDKSLTQEHLIPLNKNGSNWASNLAPACRPCNCSKGDKYLSEFQGFRVAA